MRKLLLAVCCSLLLTGSVYADGGEDALGAARMEEGLSEQVLAVTGEASFAAGFDIQESLEKLTQYVRTEWKLRLADELRFVPQLLALILLSSAAAVAAEGRMAQLVRAVGACAVVWIVGADTEGLMSSCRAALFSLQDYSHAALPTVYGTLAVMGASVSAGAGYAASCLAMEALMQLAIRIILPCIDIAFAAGVSEAIFPNALLAGLAKLARRAVVLLLTAAGLLLGAYISLTGLITASADAAVLRTGRTVFSAALPVVGGILTEASKAVIAAASVIRAGAGAFGLCAVLCLCVPSFVWGVMKLVLLRLCASAAALLGGETAGALESCAQCVELMLGLLGVCAGILIVSLTAAMKAVSV